MNKYKFEFLQKHLNLECTQNIDYDILKFISSTTIQQSLTLQKNIIKSSYYKCYIINNIPFTENELECFLSKYFNLSCQTAIDFILPIKLNEPFIKMNLDRLISKLYNLKNKDEFKLIYK